MLIYKSTEGRILNSLEIQAAKSGLLDYQAYDDENAIGIYETKGSRWQQEDRVVYDCSEKFHNLSSEEIITKVEDMVMLAQKLFGQTPNEGSTLVLSVLANNEIITTNLGDSSAFLALFEVQGQILSFERLNKQLHNPDPSTAEGRRATQIAYSNHLPIPYQQFGVWRLGDGLALSRAIGDIESESYGLIHIPDVERKSLPSNSNGFLILACDGLTERMTVHEIALLVERCPHLTADELAKLLVQNALASGSQDNISVIVASLTRSRNLPTSLALFDGHGGNCTSQALCDNFFML